PGMGRDRSCDCRAACLDYNSISRTLLDPEAYCLDNLITQVTHALEGSNRLPLSFLTIVIPHHCHSSLSCHSERSEESVRIERMHGMTWMLLATWYLVLVLGTRNPSIVPG